MKVEVELGVNLEVMVRGSGRPLVLVHGWRQSSKLFMKQIEYFESDRQVIAIDLRGHGGSDVPLHGYEISRLGHDLHQVLAALNISACDIVGHSMGCMVIWSHIKDYGGDIFNRVVFVDQAAVMVAESGDIGFEKRKWGALFTPQTLDDITLAIDSPLAGYSYIENMLTPLALEEDRSMVLQENQILPKSCAAALYRSMALSDWRDVICAIRCPALVVWGERGTYSETSQRAIVNAIPMSQFVKVSADNGGGHLVFLENASYFNRMLTTFFQI